MILPRTLRRGAFFDDIMKGLNRMKRSVKLVVSLMLSACFAFALAVGAGETHLEKKPPLIIGE